ncbi:adventurous gliding motility lipoprotein CglC [Archangium lipolyticum]|uniref:adventurous gliding motility lipoprotein CglC n=1 Tax=Archangium lipolyticum TaxID=2970465 RepID=UPI002149DA04|nr:adventurous gliding motility lipoprotein CglC [Archangium lipolyticum]
MSARLALLMAATLLCGGCEIRSDIGKRCTLVRKATAEEMAAEPERGKTRPIQYTELKPGQDFISFGMTECEDLVCVRDTSYSEPPEADGLARGYCSKSCQVDATQNDCVVNASDAEASVKDRMVCRALLLDEEAMTDMRVNDPVAYRNTFGDNNSPYFCAGAVESATN